MRGGGLPGLRRDAPGRIAAARGSFPSLHTEAARTKAVPELEVDFYADSHKKAAAMKWRTIVKAAGKWDLHPLPPHPRRALGGRCDLEGRRVQER